MISVWCSKKIYGMYMKNETNLKRGKNIIISTYKSKYQIKQFAFVPI